MIVKNGNNNTNYLNFLDKWQRDQIEDLKDDAFWK